jgi:hypothetical protein
MVQLKLSCDKILAAQKICCGRNAGAADPLSPRALAATSAKTAATGTRSFIAEARAFGRLTSPFDPVYRQQLTCLSIRHEASTSCVHDPTLRCQIQKTSPLRQPSRLQSRPSWKVLQPPTRLVQCSSRYTGLFFNVNGGYMEGIVRGYRNALLTSQNYGNVGQQSTTARHC